MTPATDQPPAARDPINPRRPLPEIVENYSLYKIDLRVYYFLALHPTILFVPEVN